MSVYDGIEETCDKLGIAPDFQSWPSRTSPVFDALIEELSPEQIFEIGSWKGGSAIRMAEICDRLSLPTVIHCIDTWLGSSEHFDGKKRDYLFPEDKHGHPLLYWQFLLNIKKTGHDKRIRVHLNTSSHTAIQFSNRGLKADLVYVDGAHDYEAVYQDLTNYGMLLRTPKSVIFGDDFHLQGVQAAVIRFAHEFRYSVEHVRESNHFILRQKS